MNRLTIVALGAALVVLLGLAHIPGNRRNVVVDQSLRRRLTRSLDPKTVVVKTDAVDEEPSMPSGDIKVVGDEVAVQAKPATENQPLSKRKFVYYQSSKWELSWLNRVDEWAAKKKICPVLMHDHSEYVHDFLNLTCTSRYHKPYDNWCVIDDEYHPLWYNTANRQKFELSWVNPMPYDARIDPPKPVVPGKEHEHIVSKFVYLDETTGERYEEYIEPLVSHLRFPLSHCIKSHPDEEEFKHHFTTFRGWIIPPPPGVRRDKTIYFDAGASSWDKGPGGPSLKYFYKMWKRHDLEFDEIYAYEMATTKEAFYHSLPGNVKDRTHYQQCAISSSPTDDSDLHPFLPAVIQRTTSPNDYVIFKLDIDSPDVEDGSILSILEDPASSNIDELFWEHHIRGNYLMKEWSAGQNAQLADVSLRESYELFLRLRQNGIRAHSWI